MKVKNSKGELKELVIKANDSIPAGSVIDFDGDVVPEGYEKVEDELEKRIAELEKYETGSANVEVETSNVQLNYYHKVGKVCTFCVEIKLAQDLNANVSVKILSGLPKPKTSVRFAAYCGSDKVCRLALSDGNIFLWYNSNKILSGNHLNIFITYITD